MSIEVKKPTGENGTWVSRFANSWVFVPKNPDKEDKPSWLIKTASNT